MNVATPLALVIATILSPVTEVVLALPFIVYVSAVVASLFVIVASYLNAYPETGLLYWSLAVRVTVVVLFEAKAGLIETVELAVATPAFIT